MTTRYDARSPAEQVHFGATSSKSGKIPTSHTRQDHSKCLYSCFSFNFWGNPKGFINLCIDLVWFGYTCRVRRNSFGSGFSKSFRSAVCPRTPLRPHAKRRFHLPHIASTDIPLVPPLRQGNPKVPG